MRRRGVAGEIQRYREDPVAFCREVLRFEPWSRQREILESVRDNSRTAREAAWTVTDLGLLAALWGAFLNDDPRLFVGGRFEGEGDHRTLVVPGGVGSDPRLFGKVAGSPIEEGSGFVRVREALRVLVANRWVEVEQTVAEMRIRRGERALKLGLANR